MIVVIADDLAGAAEVGGMALRHGLTAEVQLSYDDSADVDLVVVDTDTRSCTPGQAARRVARVAALCRESGVERAFKKVDSVLRGQVAAELAALLEAWGKCRCTLVPANPELGRVISGGRYYVRGVPLHETDFATDPEYPATTSDVLGLLGPAGPWPVQVLRVGAAMPERGIVIGEATSGKDLDAWASALDKDTLPAGASEFYAAYLKRSGFRTTETAVPKAETGEGATDLFVCGSTSAYSRSLCRQCEAQGIPVVRMPSGLFGSGWESSRLVREWADAAVQALEGHRRAMVAIDQPLCLEPGMPQILGDHLSATVEHVLSKRAVDRLFVEGGATAAALVRRLGWTRFRVCREWATGVVSMRVEGRARPTVTIKPGSYAWSDEII